MTLSAQQLLKCMPGLGGLHRAADVLPHLDAAFSARQIDTALRVAAALATMGHESADLGWMVEILDYSLDRLPRVWRRFAIDPSLPPAQRRPNALAARCARNPQALAEEVYGGRMGNGPEGSGDGWLYRGRGPAMLTGKDNYRAAGEALGLPLLAQPELAAEIPTGIRVSAWFWERRQCNVPADAGDLEEVTRRWNGGLIGIADRRIRYRRCLDALGA